jgi:hypothetical protein
MYTNIRQRNAQIYFKFLLFLWPIFYFSGDKWHLYFIFFEGRGTQRANCVRLFSAWAPHRLYNYKQKTISVAWVREWTIPTERLRLSSKLVPIFADRGCHVVSVTDPYGRILGFLDRSRYFFQVARNLYSRGWVNPVPGLLLLRKSGSAGNRTWDFWNFSQELWPLDRRGSPVQI